MAPSQFKNEQKLPKMVYNIPNFLALHFDENFMKTRTKMQVDATYQISRLQALWFETGRFFHVFPI